MSTEPGPPGGGPPPPLDETGLRRLGDAERADRREQRRRQLRRRRIITVVAVVLVILVVPPSISYARYMTRASSAPWKIRSVEWVRDNHGAWLVNFAERTWYSWHAPKKGGPALTSLPTVAGSADSPRPKPTAKTTEKPLFTPPDVKPVITPSLNDEGVWKGVGRTAKAHHPVMVTVFRNESDYPRIVTYAAWIDHTATQLALYPGRYEPPAGEPRGPMMVPEGQRDRLLAVFNSGFKSKDSIAGFAVNGHVYTSFTSDIGTLLGFDNGNVDIRSWSGGSPKDRVVFARQNLPLIVEDGKPNPSLSTNGAEWGWTLGNAVRVWRSGVGVDDHGNIIYVAAPEQTVMSLASSLIRAGAVRGLEFDINTAWPTFNYFNAAGGKSPVKFLPNPQYPGETRYLVPDDRDFFAVYTRDANGDFKVPFE